MCVEGVEVEGLGPYLTPHTKVYLSRRIDLDLKSKTLELLEEEIEKYFYDLGLGKHFLERALKVLTIKERKIIN